MQQGEASKIALFSVGDYGWNRTGFDNEQSWMAALRAVFGHRWPSAFCLLPNLSTYDQSTVLSDLIRQYKAAPSCPQRTSALLQQLKALVNACDTLAEMGLSDLASDRLLWHEIQPFTDKVGDMCRYAEALVEARSHGDSASIAATVKEVEAIDSNPRYQFKVLNGMGEDIQLSQREANPSAKVLRPFLDWLVKPLSNPTVK